MDERGAQLQRVQSSGGRTLGFVLVVAVLALVVGLGLGARLATGPSATPSSTAPSAFTGTYVSQGLWTAYLHRTHEGWALCAIADEITCHAITATPVGLPFPVSAVDWMRLRPDTVPAGQYILASPLGLHEPKVSLARIADDGTSTPIGPSDQAMWNTVWWAELGTLGSGRYEIVASAYDLSGTDSEGRQTADLVQWGLGFIVGGPSG